MKKVLITFASQFFAICSFGQQVILPGDKSINKSLLKPVTYIFDYSSISNGNLVSIGNYKMEIGYNNQTLDVNATLSFNNKNKPWRDHIVADANSFKPVSVESFRSDRSLSLNFSNQITGSLQNHNKGTKIVINEKSKGSFFDISICPYIITLLPLADGYKATIPVFDYEALSPDKVYSNVQITGVYSGSYSSNFTGEHEIWRVEGLEESTKQTFEYYIDKVSRKIWRINIIPPTGNLVYLKNSESDYNPLKSEFNKESTLKLISQGKGTIKGQAFAKDNKNGGGFQGMAVLNVNKKQFAAKGTIIVLTPYTAYFKEWNKANDNNFKKGLPSLPLPDGAKECAKETVVSDDEGHFEFSNLMPSEYLLTTTFLYEHDATSTKVVGHTDYFTNGIYQGSDAITSSENFVADVKAKIKTVAKISKEGETINIKLKKTL